MVSPFFGWISDKLLAPALVAVFFSGLTTLLIERFRGTRDALTKLTDSFREDIHEAQELVIEYWSRGAKDGDAAVEQRLLLAQTEIGATLTLLTDEFGLVVVEDHSTFIADLADAMTGGGFQVVGRAAEPARVATSVRLLTRLRLDLTAARTRHLKRHLVR